MNRYTSEPNEAVERHDELSIVQLEAAVEVITTTFGATFGPAGAVVAALAGPFAKHAASRLLELRSRVEDAGVDLDELAGRLATDERLAKLIAEVVRGTVESELAAKRGLLARAAVRALEDDAAVDVEARIVQVAVGIETVDIRVLAIIDDRQVPDAEVPYHGPGQTTNVATGDIVEKWPGVGPIVRSVSAKLASLGLVEGTPGLGTGADWWRLTDFGAEFLSRLRAAGVEDELASRG